MKGVYVSKNVSRATGATASALAMMSALLTFVLFAAPAVAQGLGFSGDFYRQEYVLAQGETSGDIEAFVIVDNPGTEQINVKMHTETPDGVTIILPEEDFVLQPGGNRRLDVVVNVSKQAALGQFTITVWAEAYREGGGIQVAGGGMQKAKLTIVKPSLNLALIIGGAGGLVVLLALGFILARRKGWFKASGKG